MKQYCIGCRFSDCERDAITGEIIWEGCDVGRNCVYGSEYMPRETSERLQAASQTRMED